MSQQQVEEKSGHHGSRSASSFSSDHETWVPLVTIPSTEALPAESKKMSKIKRTFHINVLLDNKSCDTVGLVIIKDKRESSLTLHYVRKCIKSQFDSDQMDTLGGVDRFKFLRNTVPISKRQEKDVHIRECHDPRQQIKSCFVAHIFCTLSSNGLSMHTLMTSPNG